MWRATSPYPQFVTPAKAGAIKFFQREQCRPLALIQWVPAFAGMTKERKVGFSSAT